MKTALITGVAGAIGQALVTAFKSAGYRVIGTDARRASNCDAFVQIDLEAFATDLRARKVATAALRKVLAKDTLHVLVNNAATQRLGSATEVSQADWDATMAVNVGAAFFLIQEFADDLAAVGGSAVNIASIHARLTKPAFVAYATSKAALVGLTQALAVDLGGKVRVNAIAPAAIDTPMLHAGFSGRASAFQKLARAHPTGAIGTPSDVAFLAVWLARGPAFLTGAVVGLDGGIAGRLHDPA